MSRPSALLSVLCALLPATQTLAGELPAAAVGQAIAERRARVEEFRLIKEAAEELGIRVWLFGGTAAGFAHYVRWDLARQAGDARYRGSFFDYDFTNIYRSTQDADLVVDASPEQAAQLENLIRRKMSFLQGSKEHWEVRLLRQDRTVGNGQVKQALLHNPDFLEQNTDSNSTGMIELTDPPPGESVVKDLRDWENPVPFFLQDVTRGRLHYYWSPSHRQTSRYLSGDNPEIFSVIRYLVKAFQYDLQVDGEDLARIRTIIDGFDPESDYAHLSDWAKGWLERYGPNLLRHSVNIEYAWDTLERLGLRQKLIALSNPSREHTLGWWLSREPLRTGPVGQGAGKTAAELGLDIVAHETGDFLAYESITRDTTLRPNVLISRPGHPGENAAAGAGFYTRLGRLGARGTGLTIRFRVDPQAREGSDFTVHGDFLLFTNRAALQVIPESLDVSLLQYFLLLKDGLIDPSDRGAWIKLKRRLAIRPVGEEEERAIAALVESEIDRMGREAGRSVGGPTSQSMSFWGMSRMDAPELHAPLLREWFNLPASRRYPEVTQKLVAAVSRAVEEYVRERETTPTWERDSKARALVLDWLSLPVSQEFPEILETLIQRQTLGVWDLQGLSSWIGDPRVILAVAEREDGQPHPNGWSPGQQNDPNVANNVLSESLKPSQWADNAVLKALCGGGTPYYVCVKEPLRGGTMFQVLKGLAAFQGHPELARVMAESRDAASRPTAEASAAAVEYLGQRWERYLPWFHERPEWQSRSELLDPSRWVQESQLVLVLIGEVWNWSEQGEFHTPNWGRILEALGPWSTWEEHKRHLEQGPVPAEEEQEMVTLVSGAIDQLAGDLPYSLRRHHLRLVREWLALPVARAHPEILEHLVQRQALKPYELKSLPESVTDPRIPLAVVSRSIRDRTGRQVEEALAAPQWRMNPRLRELCGGADPGMGCLRNALEKQSVGEIAAQMGWLSVSPSSGEGCREGP